MKHSSHTCKLSLQTRGAYFFCVIIVIIRFLPGVLYSQWIPQSIPVNKPVIGLVFADENTGWAITENTSLTDTAYILNTTDGGTNWNKQFQGNFALYSLYVIDNELAYAGGSDGDALLFKTTNGGLNWINLNIQVTSGVDAMFFVNADTGYIGDNLFGGLYLTTDGGLNWLQRQSGLTVDPRTLFFLNMDTGFCGGGFKMFKTVNAGVNWSELSQFGEQVMDMQFHNEYSGWAAFTNNKVGITTDGGLNWTFAIPANIGGGTVPSIFFLNDSVGWCGTRAQRIYRSSNGGLNWISQVDSSGSYSISFKDELTGWSGDFGISKTTNGGLTFLSGLSSETPNRFELYQNYPNPFNPSTRIRFTIAQSSEVTISVFDILGRQVFKWTGEGILQAGTYEYSYSGENLSAGVYIYRLTVKTSEGNRVYSDSKKMIYLK